MPTPPSTLAAQLRQLAEREQRVFASYPQVARYFPAAAIEDARERLCRAIDRGDGPGLVIGAPGNGKSLLLQVLAAQYHERFDVVLPACARLCTRRALLQSILFELGLPYKMRDEGELRLSLLDHLLSEDCPAGLLLLIDEAQALSVGLLDELRVLTNLVRGGKPRVRLILAGSSALEESFAHPELESFSQRLSARCYLAPLGREETTQYIRAQVAASGGAPDEVFSPDAWTAVFDATDGVPRLVNQLCDRALQFAATKKCALIDRSAVEQAWADIQQLPMPWDTPVESGDSATAGESIEVGKLHGDILDDNRYPAAAMLDVEPTELDDELSAIDESPTHEAVFHSIAVATASVDPFAEEYSDEEVVLDNFAAWDDLFRRERPRVENRRDPQFSTLVEAAMDASPVSASHFASSATHDRNLTSTADANAEESTDSRLSRESESTVESGTDWPRLRLIDDSDSSPADHAPLIKGVPSTIKNRSTEVEYASPNAELLSDVFDASLADEPVLIVEEENAPRPPQAPVRREEYRNLFSRLRSG